MPIPNLNSNGELEPGEYVVTLEEIEAQYGQSPLQRQKLMRGLKAAAVKLQAAGVKKLWVDGSFITDKLRPNDIDGCWEYQDGIDISLLIDDFLHRDSRKIVRERYGLDFFIAQVIEAGSGKPFPRFFQTSRNGQAKGILIVQLG